jgi:ionotropic glutamate receptor
MLATPDGNETLEGNAMYKGFCVDLLEKISKICKFNYTIKLVEDGLHGTQVNGKWNGIVRELIDKKSDLAVAALTISFQREQVIDFTKPFLNLGISILYKRPAKSKPNLFSFLAPLSVEIWVYILMAYLIISFMLFVLARFSPYEWRKQNKCSQEPNEIEIVRNDFTLFNSLWFTVGSLMQQGKPCYSSFSLKLSVACQCVTIYGLFFLFLRLFLSRFWKVYLMFSFSMTFLRLFCKIFL